MGEDRHVDEGRHAGQGRHAGLPLQVEAAGAAVREVLEQARAGLVIGVTSRGVFLELTGDTQTPDQGSHLFSCLPAWVIFLSTERFCGPLTLNLDAGASKSLQVEHQAQVRIQEGEIFFPASGLTIATRSAHPWEAPAPGETVFKPELRRRQVRDVLIQAQPAAPDLRLVNLLALALDETITIEREIQPEQALYKGLQAAAAPGRSASPAAVAERLPGAGGRVNSVGGRPGVRVFAGAQSLAKPVSAWAGASFERLARGARHGSHEQAVCKPDRLRLPWTGR